MKVTAVSEFIEQNQQHNYHQSTPSQSIKVQTASRDTLSASQYIPVYMHPAAGYYQVQNQLIAS